MTTCKPTIAAVYRSHEHSPNLTDADSRIINAASIKLQERGYAIHRYTEAQFIETDITEPAIINMCRKPRSIEKLCRLEAEGKTVINPGHAIRKCTKRKLWEISTANNIETPATVIVGSTDTTLPFSGTFRPCWLKLPDESVTDKDDIIYAGTPAEYREALTRYHSRAINEVLVCEHLEGDLLKFYAVSGDRYLYTLYPKQSGYSKFGYEANNSDVKFYPYKTERLKEICNIMSRETGITVFGGDCIITPDGKINIIDLNDWPSFSPCAEEASEAIAAAVAETIETTQHAR
ncbi:MAG: hypothetical protein IAC54_03010 [Bacteroidetes bacterium]|uniref:ATP-grasp domain-containing protein n=1 Tax=Candidatus Caccoplasma merdipullorum TaxID=2840718 RepID=A0A9D9H3L2_9BACT|nr:hypothetical protein [Candidatus Caccoplasma merdipullorum]